MLIYLHIPKAAGSTLRTAIEPLYRSDEVYIVGDDIPSDERRFVDLSVHKKMKLKLLFGHIGYGWHVYLPPNKDYRYATILRNPIDRVYSLYLYIKRSPGHFLYDEVVDMSLIDFVNSGVHTNADNGMVRQLCGLDEAYNNRRHRLPYDDGLIPYGYITHKHLELAISNIMDFWIVDTVDRFDNVLRRMCESVGRGVPWFRIQNATPRSVKKPLTCEERIAVARHNTYDWELYETASRIWQ